MARLEVAILAPRFPEEQHNMHNPRRKHERAGDGGDGRQHHRRRERVNRVPHERERAGGHQRRRLGRVDPHPPRPAHVPPAGPRREEAQSRHECPRPGDRGRAPHRPEHARQVRHNRDEKRLRDPDHHRRRPDHPHEPPGPFRRQQVRRPPGPPASLGRHPQHAIPVRRDDGAEQEEGNGGGPGGTRARVNDRRPPRTHGAGPCAQSRATACKNLAHLRYLTAPASLARRSRPRLIRLSLWQRSLAWTPKRPRSGCARFWT